mgnify:CR=1 FL=1
MNSKLSGSSGFSNVTVRKTIFTRGFSIVDGESLRVLDFRPIGSIPIVFPAATPSRLPDFSLPQTVFEVLDSGGHVQNISTLVFH